MSTQVALITGASRGLGLEVARAYARRGLRLILTARGAAALQLAADDIRLTTEVVALPGNVRKTPLSQLSLLNFIVDLPSQSRKA